MVPYGPLSIRVRRQYDGSYVLHAQQTNIAKKMMGEKNPTVRIKRNLDRDKVDNILQRLKILHVPAAPDFESGCDGGTTEVRIVGPDSGASYKWWVEAPDGWEELESIADEVIEMAGMSWEMLT